MKRRVVHTVPDRERPARMEVDVLRERVEELEKVAAFWATRTVALSKALRAALKGHADWRDQARAALAGGSERF